jgi:hypothetical protein
MMANYYASCRTNYFKVKDDEAFENAMSEIPGVEVTTDAAGYGLLGDDPDGAGWPGWYMDDDDNEIEVDIYQAVAEHLVDGEVAIFMESGAEKLRYIVGFAVAVNNKGEIKALGLNDIYKMAKELTDRPDDITVAEY